MRYAHVGTMLIAPMIALGVVGYVLDRRFATEPWLLLAMVQQFINADSHSGGES